MAGTDGLGWQPDPRPAGEAPAPPGALFPTAASTACVYSARCGATTSPTRSSILALTSPATRRRSRVGLGLTAISTSTVPPTLRALPLCTELPVPRRFRYRALPEPQRRDRCDALSLGSYGWGAGRKAHVDTGAHAERSGLWRRRAALGGAAGSAATGYYSKVATAFERKITVEWEDAARARRVRKAPRAVPHRAPLVRRDPHIRFRRTEET